MSRKLHLEHTVSRGPTCKTGRTGAALSGEHITVKFAEFEQGAALRCERCRSSKLFAFLARKAAAAK